MNRNLRAYITSRCGELNRWEFLTGLASVSGLSVAAGCGRTLSATTTLPATRSLAELMTINGLARITYRNTIYKSDGTVTPMPPRGIIPFLVDGGPESVVPDDWNPSGASCVPDSHPPAQGSNWMVCTDGNGKTIKIQQIGSAVNGASSDWSQSGYGFSPPPGTGAYIGPAPTGSGPWIGPAYYGNFGGNGSGSGTGSGTGGDQCTADSVDIARQSAEYVDRNSQAFAGPALMAAQAVLGMINAGTLSAEAAWEFMVLLLSYMGPVDFLIMIGAIGLTFGGLFTLLQCLTG